MKTLIPLIVGFIAGLFGVTELYIDHEGYRSVQALVRDFVSVLAAMAFPLAAVNLFQVNYPIIRRRDRDWGFKLLLLLSAGLMVAAGVRLDKLYAPTTMGTVAYSSGDSGSEHGTIKINSARKEALVSIDDGPPMRAWHSGEAGDIFAAPGSIPLTVAAAPGQHSVTVMMPVTGYGKFVSEDVQVDGGVAATVTTSLPLLWGNADDCFDGYTITYSSRAMRPCLRCSLSLSLRQHFAHSVLATLSLHCFWVQQFS